MKKRTRNGFSKSFHILYLVCLISIALTQIIGITEAGTQMIGSLWLIVYANIYLIIPLIIISLIGSIICDFKLYGKKQGIKETSLRLLMIIAAAYIFMFATNTVKHNNNKIEVTLENKSSTLIKHIKLHGRNALSEFDNLMPEADTIIVFRGKEIIYDTDNDFENEVTLLYYMDSTWYREPILQGFNRWRVWNGPFHLTIYNPGSVEFKYTEEQNIPKN